MAFCKHCGTQMEDGVKFCPSCGGKRGMPLLINKLRLPKIK